MSHKKIIVAIGGNLHSKNGLHPVEICQEAIKSLKSMSIIVEKQSSWYSSDPIPKSDQPKFFNSVLVASTTLNELDVLNMSLHGFRTSWWALVDSTLTEYVLFSPR